MTLSFSRRIFDQGEMKACCLVDFFPIPFCRNVEILRLAWIRSFDFLKFEAFSGRLENDFDFERLILFFFNDMKGKGECKGFNTKDGTNFSL